MITAKGRYRVEKRRFITVSSIYITQLEGKLDPSGTFQTVGNL